MQRANYAGAAQAFETCLKKRAQWAEAQMNLALSYWKMGERDLAQLVYEQVLNADPKNMDAVRGLAALALERSDFDQALEYHGRLIDLGERSSEVLYNAGLLLQKAGQMEDAARLYREAAEENPDFAEAMLNLGHVLKALGQEEEARTCWSKALEAKPELAQGSFEPARN